MAHCEPEGRKHPSMDLYAGIFSGNLYSSNRNNGGGGHYRKWCRFDALDHAERYKYEQLSPFGSPSFGEDGYRHDTRSSEFSHVQKQNENGSIPLDVSSVRARKEENPSTTVASNDENKTDDMPDGFFGRKLYTEQKENDGNGNKCHVGLRFHGSTDTQHDVVGVNHIESRVCMGLATGVNRCEERANEDSGFSGSQISTQTSNVLACHGSTVIVRNSFRETSEDDKNGDMASRQYGRFNDVTNEDSNLMQAKSSTSSGGKLTVLDKAADDNPSARSLSTSCTKKSGELCLSAQSRNPGESCVGLNDGGINGDVYKSTEILKSDNSNLVFAGKDARVDSFISNRPGSVWSARSSKSGEQHGFSLNRPGSDWSVRYSRSGELGVALCGGFSVKNSPGQGSLKGSPGREYPFGESIKTSFPISLDSSSSNEGTSNGGSPTATEAIKDNTKLSPLGNILGNKGDPNSGSFRSQRNEADPRPSNACSWKSGDTLPQKNSGEMLINASCNVKSRIEALSGVSGGNLWPNNANAGNINNGNSNGKGVNNANTTWNTGSLLVGTANGNVVSYGAGTKQSNKSADVIQSNNMVDVSQMKRVLSSQDPDEIKSVGNEFYRRGQFSEALMLYDKAIALCPDQAPYRSNRAAVLSGLGRLGEAVQECKEVIRLDPSYTRAHQRLASLYLRLGLIELSKKHFQASGQQTDLVDVQRLHNIEKHIVKCLEARKSMEWDSVIRESDAAVVAGAEAASQLFGFKAEALLKLQRLEEADTICTAAQKLEASLWKLNVIPTDAFLLIIRVQIEMAFGRFEGAVAAAESAMRVEPSNSEVALLLKKAQAVSQSRATGNELFKAGKYFEALVAYSEGLEGDPTNSVLRCNRAACRSKLGQWEKAIEDCDAALRVQPNYLKAIMRRANCWTKLERLENALRDYEILRREMPEDMEVARGFFDVLVAIKRSQGEETYKMKFGGDIEEIFNYKQFRDAVSSPGLSVVQFSTRWSDRCRQISPFIDELCKRYPYVNFVKVDVDENPELSKSEFVTFVPTFKMYRNGQKVKEIMGPSLQSLEYTVKHYST